MIKINIHNQMTLPAGWKTCLVINLSLKSLGLLYREDISALKMEREVGREKGLKE